MLQLAGTPFLLWGIYLYCFAIFLANIPVQIFVMTYTEPQDFCRTENFPSRKPWILSLINERSSMVCSPLRDLFSHRYKRSWKGCPSSQGSYGIRAAKDEGATCFFSAGRQESWRWPNQEWSVWLGFSRVHKDCWEQAYGPAALVALQWLPPKWDCSTQKSVEKKIIYQNVKMLVR